MTAAECTPVSWLRLERYALGELAEGERADVAAHLAGCGRCRACADGIAAEASRALPPLPAVAPAPRAARWRWRWPDPSSPSWGRRQAFAFAAVLAVFAGVFALRPGERVQLQPVGPRVVAVKGGDVTVELVRERAGSVAWEPTSFGDDDRFKVLLTCAPPLAVHADVVVLQGDGPAFPGQPALLRCGNRVPVPTTFRITGAGPATVCALIDPTAPPSRALSSGGDPAFGARACVHLDHAR